MSGYLLVLFILFIQEILQGKYSWAISTFGVPQGSIFLFRQKFKTTILSIAINLGPEIYPSLKTNINHFVNPF